MTERHKLRAAKVPQLPRDICRAGNCLTAEQERTANLVLEAATWAIRGVHQMREDKPAPYTPREFSTVQGITRAV